jgi:SAM-dependent methyltransferase
LSHASSAGGLEAEIIRLSPWYFDMDLEGGVRTRVYLDAPPQPGFTKVTISLIPPEGGQVIREAFVPEENLTAPDPTIPFINPRDKFMDTLRRVYPEGLEGRSVLDCACNCGAYLFWAKEMGAGRCFGFDVREHWIRQARFLAEHRDGPTDEMSFEVVNLYDLPERGLEMFDIVLFNGILYHLPDPLSGLGIAAALAKELLVIDTSARKGMPDGMLVSTEQPLRMAGGLYGMRWLPTGPQALSHMVRSMGYEETRCSWWHDANAGPVRDRIEVLAAREAGYLEGFDRSLGEGPERVSATASRSAAPDTVVLVVSGGDERLLQIEGREGRHFPQDEGGGWSSAPMDGADAAEQLASLRASGADYLVVPADGAAWVRERDELRRALERCPVIASTPDCEIFALNPARADAADVAQDLARRRARGLRRA